MSKPNVDPTATKQLNPTFVSVADAADRLGVTSDAIRMRLKRGALTGEKRGGRLFVQLPDPIGNQTADPTSNPTTDRTEAQRLPDVDLLAVVAAKDAALDHAEREIDWLRDQLSERSRELAAANERADVLHRIALNRLESLTAGNAPASLKTAQDGPSEAFAPATMPSPGNPDAARTRRFARWWSALTGRR